MNVFSLLFFLFCFFSNAFSITVITLSPKLSSSNPLVVDCPKEKVDPNESITWEYKNATQSNPSLLPVTSPSLTLTTLTQVGRYFCKQTNTTLAEYHMVYLAAPIFENTRQSATYNEGDMNKKLTCTSAGSYPAVEFTWAWKPEGGTWQALPSGNATNMTITHATDKSTLVFSLLTFDVQGFYKCSVDNVAGNSSVQIQVRVKDKLAALWPFLGIVCEVTVLILIIFIYERRSKKAIVNKAGQYAGEVSKSLNEETEHENGNSALRNRAAPNSPNNNHK